VKLRLSRFAAIGQIVPTIGRPHPPGPCHDGANAVMAHQPLDAATAHPAALGLQLGMNPRTAVASVSFAMDPLDVVDEVTIGGGSAALRARPPGIIASRRDPEHVAQDRHRIVGAAIFDEAKSHFGTPAKIAIDFLRNSHLSVAWSSL
jgi:hypothetical protein